MEIATIHVEQNRLDIRQNTNLARGTVGAAVTFEDFSSDWVGLSKTAVFRNREVTRDVVNIQAGQPVEIPWEVLDAIGADLMVGVCGTNKNGSTVIPTVWGMLGKIVSGASPSGRPSEPPSPDWTRQIEGQVNEAIEKAIGVAPLAQQAAEDALSAAAAADKAVNARDTVVQTVKLVQSAVVSAEASVSDARAAARKAGEKASAASDAAGRAAVSAVEAGEASASASVHAETAETQAARAQKAADQTAGDILKLAIKPTVSAEVIALEDSAEWPVLGLTVYGKITQAGVPGPDRPVPMIPAGAEGKLTENLAGGNLLDVYSAAVWEAGKQIPGSARVTVTGELVRVDILKEGSSLFVPTADIPGKSVREVEYSLSVMEKSAAFNGRWRMRSDTGAQIGAEHDSGEIAADIPMDGQRFGKVELGSDVRLRPGDYVVFKGYFAGNHPGFTPYRPICRLSIPAPDGLMGVPDLFGYNYVSSDGTKYACDYVDLSSREYVRQIEILDVRNLLGSMRASAPAGTYCMSLDHNRYRPNPSGCNLFVSNILCSRFKACKYYVYGDAGNQEEVSGLPGGVALGIYGELMFNMSGIPGVADVNTAKQWFQDHPTQVAVCLRQPVTVPLTGEVLEKFRSFRTAYPYTTVYNDQNAGQTIQYVAEPTRYLDHALGRIAAVENRLEPLNGGI